MATLGPTTFDRGVQAIRGAQGMKSGRMVAMKMLSAIPSLPVLDVARATTFYTAKLGFTVRFQDSGFAILVQDDVELHVWAANQPEVPGGEPYLAGSASCRIRVDDAESIYQVCDHEGIVHPNGRLATQPWGTREFTVLDADGNCVVFYQPAPDRQYP